jgi:hydroxymethylpyrimidine/phosphomethylpyrimidine kinase
MHGRVLAIAGSDSGGGAGIQADIKAITALDGYAATAITALTAQNTLGVQGVRMVPPEFVYQQIFVVLDDIGADAIKTGMLGDVATIETVADAMARYATDIPFVLDPVMVAKGGARLLDPGAVHALTRHLLPKASVITPNLPEAEVLVKGGHLPGDDVIDLLATADGIEEFAAPRIVSAHTHGTGCTLASAVATGLAQAMELRDAVQRARAYVRAAIAAAPGFGGGHGPLNHAVSGYWPS